MIVSRRNELITYEALGLCEEGDAERFIENGDNTYGGRFVTNPSGGLLSKGHPLGATGLAQCWRIDAASARPSRRLGKWTARVWPCSTIWGSAGPAS